MTEDDVENLKSRLRSRGLWRKMEEALFLILQKISGVTAILSWKITGMSKVEIGSKVRVAPYMKYLIKKDHASLIERAVRLNIVDVLWWKDPLTRRGGQHMFHTMATYFSFEDAIWCFVNGLFIGCVISSQAVIEKQLVGAMEFLNKEYHGRGFSQVIGDAQKRGLITPEEYQQLDHLRTRRNIFTHMSADNRHRIGILDSIARTEDEEKLFLEDACKAMSAMFKIMDKPFIHLGDNPVEEESVGINDRDRPSS